MKKFVLLACIACAVPGCTANQIANSILPGKIETVINEPLGDRTLRDEQGLWAAEAAYNVPAAAYVSAHSRGLVNDDLKAILKPRLITLYDLLKAARTAYRFGDAAGFTAKKEALEALRNEIMPLIPN